MERKERNKLLSSRSKSSILAKVKIEMAKPRVAKSARVQQASLSIAASAFQSYVGDDRQDDRSGP